MLRHAIDHGVNYVDTAYPYHGGKSEVVVGRALQDGYREKVRLATKLPTWLVQAPRTSTGFWMSSSTKLQTDHIDFYLLHSLNKAWWANIVLKHSLLGDAERALADGRIGHLGFSFHDNYECFRRDRERERPVDLLPDPIQLHGYREPGGHARAQAGRGKGAGSGGDGAADGRPAGRSAAGDSRNYGEPIPPRRSPAELAFDWVWDQPEVSVVLSGMSTMDQVAENLRFADAARVGKLGAADQELIARIREQYKARVTIPCTQCGYCMPCPNGVNIPVNFDLFNYAHTYDDLGAAQFRYKFVLKEEQRAGACIDCDTCEELCPHTSRSRIGCLRWRRCWADSASASWRVSGWQFGARRSAEKKSPFPRRGVLLWPRASGFPS